MDIKGQTRKGDQGELEEYGDIALPLSSGFKYQATSENNFLKFNLRSANMLFISKE